MEGIEILSITDLVKKADIRWKAEAKKRKEHQDQLKAKMAVALAEESGLIKELTAEKKAVNGLQQDYFELEKKAESQEKQRVEKTALTAEKVQSGEITLRQFQARGISEKQKTELIIEGTLKELEESLNLIRIKKTKILKKELNLAILKRKVFRLSLYPAEILIKSYKEAGEFVNREMGELYNDMSRSDSSVKLIEHQIHLTEGRGLSEGHRWDRLTLEQAQKILFDPIIPESLIADFKKQLQEFEGEGLINVLLHLPGGKSPSIEVQPTAGIGAKKLIQTGEKIKKVKKSKAVNTADLK